MLNDSTTRWSPNSPEHLLYDKADAIYRESLSSRHSAPHACRAYNIVMSALAYLDQGSPLHGSRTALFFQEAA